MELLVTTSVNSGLETIFLFACHVIRIGQPVILAAFQTLPAMESEAKAGRPVSYTHLTLPTMPDV